MFYYAEYSFIWAAIICSYKTCEQIIYIRCTLYGLVKYILVRLVRPPPLVHSWQRRKRKREEAEVQEMEEEEECRRRFLSCIIFPIKEKFTSFPFWISYNGQKGRVISAGTHAYKLDVTVATPAYLPACLTPHPEYWSFMLPHLSLRQTRHVPHTLNENPRESSMSRGICSLLQPCVFKAINHTDLVELIPNMTAWLGSDDTPTRIDNLTPHMISPHDSRS